MRTWLLRSVAVAGVMIAAASVDALTGDEKIQSVDQAMQSVAVEDVRVSNGQVLGRVINKTDLTVRNVRLRVLFSWRWKNETRPGVDDMSTGIVDTLTQEIPPGASVNFSYPIPAGGQGRNDGWYHIEVNVAGFSSSRKTVIPAS